MSPESNPRTLYLVDGTAQVFRAYFAIRGLTNDEGMPTNAVFGFTNVLRKLVKDERPSYLAVAFDLEGPTFRHERFAEYKANRPPPPEDLNVQFPYARKVCEVFNVPVLEKPGYEADDLIATYTRLAREAGFDVVMVASDKDLLQLVGDGVTNFNPGKDLRLDADGVRENFGVAPELVRDVLGLMGDSVDNIPGVPGVGEKTAKAMVNTYGAMESVLERASRFVAAYDARDAAIASLETVEKDDPLEKENLVGALRSLSRLEDALTALLEVEADDTMRSRFEEARSAVEGANSPGWMEAVGGPGKKLGKSTRPLKKTLKGLDPKSGKKQWYAVVENREQAILSRELATLDSHAPADHAVENLAVAPPDREKAAALFGALGFRTLTAEFSAPAEDTDETGEPAGEAAAEYRTVLTLNELKAAAGACRRAGRFAVDTETDGVDPMRAKLVGISMSWEPGSGVYAPVGHEYLGAPEQIPLDAVTEVLAPLLADPTVGKVGQNIKYDLHILRRHGMPLEGIALDTMVAAFLINSSRSSYKMDTLAAEYLGHTTITYEEVAGKGARQVTLDEVDVAKVTEYAAEDSDVTLRLANLFEARLEESGLDKLYRTIDGPLLPVLASMEANGIRVDVHRLAAMSAEMEASIDLARAEIHRLAGEEFNVDSPKQLREVLFDRLGLKPGRKTAKGGVHSTDAQTLEKLAGDHPIAPKILAYRELAKLKGTYVDALPLLVNPATGRVHTSYHPTGAATGRLSSSDPNLQNIPARTETGLRIREAFVPDDGYVYLAADYSQVELRVLAHLCRDPELVAAFRDGEDIHRHTASRVSGVPPDLVTTDLRRRAKAVNFGILYGMSETRLAREQGMSRAEARHFIQTYFERFGEVRAYIDRTREEALHDAAVRTMFDRRRFFPELHQKVGRMRQEQALRAAVNTTIQGTAADLMKLAMLRVARELRESSLSAKLLLQVHDELLLEVPAGEAEETEALVRDAMEGVWPMEVPLAVDSKTGANWREVT